MNFITAKILVVTGRPYSSGINSEIISFRTDIDTYSDSPHGLYGGTGGVVNNRALICGGYVNISGAKRNKCLFLGKSGWIEFTDMIHERAYASSIVINDKVSIS